MDYDWDKVAGELIERSQGLLWRKHSDMINSMLLDKWLSVRKEKRGLKTDLFDEAVSSGLYSIMEARTEYIFGMDLSERVLLKVKSLHPDLRSVGADARHLPFSDEVFDYVVSNSTLDHFTSYGEIVAALREIYRVLRPGGELILTLDNPANPVLALRRLLPFRFLREVGLLPYYIGKTYSPWRLRGVLGRIGMNVIEIRAIMHFPRVLVVALGEIIDKLGGRRIYGRLLKAIMAFEGMSKLPTEYLTGYFVAARAQKKCQ